MLHQDKCLDEFRGLMSPVAVGRWKVLINALAKTQGVHLLSKDQ